MFHFYPVEQSLTCCLQFKFQKASSRCTLNHSFVNFPHNIFSWNLFEYLTGPPTKPESFQLVTVTDLFKLCNFDTIHFLHHSFFAPTYSTPTSQLPNWWNPPHQFSLWSFSSTPHKSHTSHTNIQLFHWVYIWLANLDNDMPIHTLRFSLLCRSQRNHTPLTAGEYLSEQDELSHGWQCSNPSSKGYTAYCNRLSKGCSPFPFPSLWMSESVLFL